MVCPSRREAYDSLLSAVSTRLSAPHTNLPQKASSPSLQGGHSLLTLKHSHTPPLSRDDHPHVKFWFKHEWRSHRRGNQTITDPNNPTPVRGSTRASQGINVAMQYVEDISGNPVSGFRTTAMRQHAHAIFTRLHELGLAPHTWGAARSDVKDTYLLDMEETFSELKLGAAHWKAHHIATQIYPSWYHNHFTDDDNHKTDDEGIYDHSSDNDSSDDNAVKASKRRQRKRGWTPRRSEDAQHKQPPSKKVKNQRQPVGAHGTADAPPRSPPASVTHESPETIATQAETSSIPLTGPLLMPTADPSQPAHLPVQSPPAESRTPHSTPAEARVQDETPITVSSIAVTASEDPSSKPSSSQVDIELQDKTNAAPPVPIVLQSAL